MKAAEAFAKINVGLVVGPARPDGKHEVVTLLQRIELSDSIAVEPSPDREVVVEGFADTTVRSALTAFRAATRAEHGWSVRIDKRIPVAAGLGGGSSDAGTALRLANELSGHALSDDELHALAVTVGADVPFFLEDGARLAGGDGSELVRVALPRDIAVVLVLPHGQSKESTAAVYERFDERRGPAGFESRRDAMVSALDGPLTPASLAALPRNDLASSPLTNELEDLGAFRADVSGAGPAVYGLFEDNETAERAERELRPEGTTWLTRTVDGG
jgi:4-diphosphocytidyl-2-C-methyl-D-erythritol kinase